MDQKLLLVGCGKMGQALLSGWLKDGLLEENVRVVEPLADNNLQSRFNLNFVKSVDSLDPNFHPEFVVFAVKPQVMDNIVPLYFRFVRLQTVFLSIAAGKSTKYLESLLTKNAPIIRSMPNLPAAVGQGMTVAYKNSNVSKKQKVNATKMLEAVGEVGWVKKESLIDCVTAISGSGPAYVFLLIECLEKSAIELGLNPDLARQLAIVTVSGSSGMVRKTSESPEMLRKNVTSPGGTTEAALEVLMGSDGLEELINAAVIAAENRSRELAE
ncbi:MAG: pyrroline-5-carboxylate reductase [Rhodospirillales bacterium]|nr:pyrroline-5-carboxylate reductase [Rhodospirillales bacterium]